MSDPINRFADEYAWLSNFYPCEIKMDGLVYPNVESAYVSAKVVDKKEKARIHKLSLQYPPGYIKKVGRSVNMRQDWDGIKLEVMEECLKQKFALGTELAKMLVATGERELIEGNTWNDRYWGVCNGVGRNHLGKLLMKRRKDLQLTQFLVN